MIHKKLFKSIRYSCFRRGYIKFLYNSKFDLTANLLVTDTVVTTRGLCTHIEDMIKNTREAIDDSFLSEWFSFGKGSKLYAFAGAPGEGGGAEGLAL